jgi:hypothetical protein
VEAPPEEVTVAPEDVEEPAEDTTDDPHARLAEVEFDETPESTVDPRTVEGEQGGQA